MIDNLPTLHVSWPSLGSLSVGLELQEMCNLGFPLMTNRKLILALTFTLDQEMSDLFCVCRKYERGTITAENSCRSKKASGLIVWLQIRHQYAQLEKNRATNINMLLKCFCCSDRISCCLIKSLLPLQM